MKTIADFTVTTSKSPMSLVCRYMSERSLERVIYFRLRGYTDAQRHMLRQLVAEGLIHIIKLPVARRQIWLIRPRCDQNDVTEMERIRTYLTVALGPKCRVRVYVVWRCLY